MSDKTRDPIDHYWNDDGSPSEFAMGQGIQVWQACQPDGTATIGAAALAFHRAPEIIVSAVEEHPWLYVYQNQNVPMAEWLIEQDGE